ncbi:MAG: plasma-membrane proton-efflux P-type ATPase [Steroidobacteraceae bacterium]
MQESVKLDQLPLPELWKKLESSPAGLSAEEARRRLERFGYNELPDEKVNPLRKFLSYLWGPIPWMIEIAIILSALVRHWADFYIILVLLITNAVVGFWEEYQAAGAIAALKAQLALRARVRRGGAWTVIASRELVPGDLVRLRIGDIVPADARLLEGDPIEVDQSALTGESLPVTHASGEGVYSGSIIKRGEIDALVYGTGRNTYFGKTAGLVAAAHTVSHFQRAVLKIGDYLILIAIALVVLILGVALYRGDPMLRTLEFVLILTVAAIPVAMPTVLSVTMAVGARILARAQAIVSRLVSIEELAGMDLLCSDKTGTLTQNRLTLGTPCALQGVPPAEIIRCAALASRREDEDPIDAAVLSGVGASSGDYGLKVVHFQPFDPVSKRTEATLSDERGATFKVSKGAPQAILALLADASKLRAILEQAVQEFASRGFRSLGVARTDASGAWQYLGVLPLFDPPREDSKATIATAKQMGIAVKMVTGDQVAIAKEIARQVGLGPNILDAKLLEQTKPHESGQVEEAIERADGFAQVFPEHKYHIVDVLQKRGHIVGMTGDGVNDAPALKKADAGIAVSGATEAARAAAAIVLLAPGLAVIIDAIKESRKIFQRMNSYAVYRIAETIRVLLFMTLSILVFNFYPVTAVMIVLLALLNDGAILSIAYDRVRYSNLPEAWNMHRVLGVASALGVTGVVASFLLFYLAERVFHLSRDVIQSFMYLKLSVAGQLTIYLARTRGPFWSIRPSRLLLGATVSAQIVATLIATFGLFMPPIGWRYAALIWLYAIAWFLISDRVKLLAYRIFDPRQLAVLPALRAKNSSPPGEST